MSACIVNKNNKYYLCTVNHEEAIYDRDFKNGTCTLVRQAGFYLYVTEIELEHSYYYIQNANCIHSNCVYTELLYTMKVNRFDREEKCTQEIMKKLDYYIEQYELKKAGMENE